MTDMARDTHPQTTTGRESSLSTEDLAATPSTGADSTGTAGRTGMPGQSGMPPSGMADPYPDEAPAAPSADAVPLVDPDEADLLQGRWSDVQGRFVDDPREAVRDADALVAEAMQSLARSFSERKGALEDQWSRDEEVDTEQLRLALQSYRSFFSRLLSA